MPIYPTILGMVTAVCSGCSGCSAFSRRLRAGSVCLGCAVLLIRRIEGREVALPRVGERFSGVPLDDFSISHVLRLDAVAPETFRKPRRIEGFALVDLRPRGLREVAERADDGFRGHDVSAFEHCPKVG
jgi:hypothetical protein